MIFIKKAGGGGGCIILHIFVQNVKLLEAVGDSGVYGPN